MRISQSCGTCTHCVRGDSLNIERGNCHFELHSQMLLVPSSIRNAVEPRVFAYFPEVALKGRGCSRFTPALEVSEAEEK